jgi:hypothetical protein
MNELGEVIAQMGERMAEARVHVAALERGPDPLTPSATPLPPETLQ